MFIIKFIFYEHIHDLIMYTYIIGCRVNIPRKVLEELSLEDRIGMFADPVTEAVAENYFDIIRNPMDLRSMNNKAIRGQYKSMQSLRHDFELMVMNAMLYNKSGDEYFTTAYHFYEKILQYFQLLPRQTHGTACGNEIMKMMNIYKQNMKDLRLEEAKESQSIVTLSMINDEAKKERAALRAARTLQREKRMHAEVSVDDVDEGGATALTTASTDMLQLEVSNVGNGGTSIHTPSDQLVVTSVNSNNPILDSTPNLPISTTTTNTRKDPNPICSFNCAVYSIQSDDAFYLSCLDTCLVCGSSGQSIGFIFCIDCGEAFHSFCANIPLGSMTEEARFHWRCNNCKICEVCHTATVEEEASLVFCDACDRAFHMNCLQPRLESTPSGSWICHHCCDCHGVNNQKCINILNNSVSTWGNFTNTCCMCYELTQKQALEKSICNICNVNANNDAIISCRYCHQRIHLKCAEYCTEDSSSQTYADYICSLCAPIYINSLDMQSHLEEYSPNIWDLLSKVACIQRNEYVISTRLSYDRTVDLCRKGMINSFWKSDRILLRCIVKAAFSRINNMKHTTDVNTYISTLESSISITHTHTLLLQLRIKALQFLRMYMIDANVLNFLTQSTTNSLVDLRVQAVNASVFLFVSEKDLLILSDDNMILESIANVVNNHIQHAPSTPSLPPPIPPNDVMLLPTLSNITTTTTTVPSLPTVPLSGSSSRLSLENLAEANSKLFLSSLKVNYTFTLLFIPIFSLFSDRNFSLF